MIQGWENITLESRTNLLGSTPHTRHPIFGGNIQWITSKWLRIHSISKWRKGHYKKGT